MDADANGNPIAILTPDRRRAPLVVRTATAVVSWRSVMQEVVFRITEEADDRIFEDGSIMIV